MSERQEKKRRRFQRWEYQCALYEWQRKEPCKLLFWRWFKWKKNKPVLRIEESRSGKGKK